VQSISNLASSITNIGELERDDDGDDVKGSGYGVGITGGMFTVTLFDVEGAKRNEHVNIRNMCLTYDFVEKDQWQVNLAYQHNNWTL